MLRPHTLIRNGTHLPARQQGVVLFIALIALVAMTLAAIALVRSVDTANVIAGNLAFQQGGTNNGDIAIEDASNWLVTHNSGTTLFNNSTTSNPATSDGYFAIRQDPNPGQNWADFWTGTLAGSVKTLATDTATGNTISYVIHRMCANAGNPLSTSTDCANSLATSNNQTNSRSAGSVGLQGSTQVYYRITARIAGPRNTVSYVQAMILL